MSYAYPTPADREVLLDFYDRLRASFDCQTANHDTTVDLLKTDFDRYLSPENHTEFSRPFPPVGRREFQSLTVAERKDRVQEIGRERIQETMEDAALLSHLHGIEMDDIDGLEQSSEAIREQIQQERNADQAKVTDYGVHG